MAARSPSSPVPWRANEMPTAPSPAASAASVRPQPERAVLEVIARGYHVAPWMSAPRRMDVGAAKDGCRRRQDGSMRPRSLGPDRGDASGARGGTSQREEREAAGSELHGGEEQDSRAGRSGDGGEGHQAAGEQRKRRRGDDEEGLCR